MSRSMIQAAVTMNQLQNKLDVIGNNLANSQTTGYKNRNAQFSSLLFQQINHMQDEADNEGRLTPEGLRVGSGAKLSTPTVDLSLGTILETSRDLDVALLQKNHLFQIEATNGETHYTRDGSFYLSPLEENNDMVMLTTKNGNPVLGAEGPIIFQAGFDQIDLSENGQIMVQRGDSREIVGQLAVVEATTPRSLEAVGNNEFRVPDALNVGDIIQGAEAELRNRALESSNVDVGKQMTELIMAQRSYQFNARTISTSDQMMGLINQLRS